MELCFQFLNDSHNFKQFIRKVKLFRELNFNSLSVQSVPKKKISYFRSLSFM